MAAAGGAPPLATSDDAPRGALLVAAQPLAPRL